MQKIMQTFLKLETFKCNITTPFQWTSGALSPIYSDNRKILSFVNEREEIITSLGELVKETFGDNIDMVIGIATAGISWAILLAKILNKPFVYVRAQAQAEDSFVEGNVYKSQRVLLVDDVLATGGTILKIADRLTKEHQLHVIGAVVLFSYNITATLHEFAKRNLTIAPLTNIDEFIQLAITQQLFNITELNIVTTFLKNLSDQLMLKKSNYETA